MTFALHFEFQSVLVIVAAVIKVSGKEGSSGCSDGYYGASDC